MRRAEHHKRKQAVGIMNSSFEHFFWQQRELQHALENMRPTLDALNHLPRALAESVAQLDVLRNQFMLPPDYLASTQRIQEALASRPTFESFELLSGLSSQATMAFQRQQSEIGEAFKKIASPVSDIESAIQRMFNSVASTEALLGLQRLSEPLIELALQPQLAFQEFAKRHLEIAATGSTISQQNRLLLVNASVDLLDSITKGFDLAALMRPPHEDLWLGSIPKVNVYSSLGEELEFIDLEQPAIDAESAVEESQSGTIAELGAQLIQLVYDLNVEAEREGGAPVFKPTTKALMACSLIPSRVAYDSASFSEVTDYLFFLLYEGSGSAQRLTAKLDQSRLNPLWTLKHLRLGSRHDTDHGTERDAEKKNRQVGEAYKRLVGRVAPRTKREWMSAQIALYKELVEMLELIWFGEDE